MTLELECRGDGGDGRTWVTCASGETLTLVARASESATVTLRGSPLRWAPTSWQGKITLEPPAAPDAPWLGHTSLDAPLVWPLRLSGVAAGQPTTTLWLVPRTSLAISTLIVVAAAALTLTIVAPTLATLQVTLTGAIEGLSGAAGVALMWKLATWSTKLLVDKQLPWLGVTLLIHRALLAALVIILVPCALHVSCVTRIYNGTPANIEIARPGGLAVIAPGKYMSIIGEQESDKDILAALRNAQNYCSGDGCQGTKVPGPQQSPLSRAFPPHVVEVRCARHPWLTLDVERATEPDCSPRNDEARDLYASLEPPYDVTSSRTPVTYSVIYPWVPDTYASVNLHGLRGHNIVIEPINPTEIPLFKRMRAEYDESIPKQVRVPALRVDAKLHVSISRGTNLESTLDCESNISLDVPLEIQPIEDLNVQRLVLTRESTWTSTWRSTSSSARPWVCVPPTDGLSNTGLPDTMFVELSDETARISLLDYQTSLGHVEISHEGARGKVSWSHGGSNTSPAKSIYKPNLEGVWPGLRTIEIVEHGEILCAWTSEGLSTPWLCDFGDVGVKGRARYEGGVVREIELRGGTLTVLPRVCVRQKGVLRYRPGMEWPSGRKSGDLSKYADHHECDKLYEK